MRVFRVPLGGFFSPTPSPRYHRFSLFKLQGLGPLSEVLTDAFSYVYPLLNMGAEGSAR